MNHFWNQVWDRERFFFNVADKGDVAASIVLIVLAVGQLFYAIASLRKVYRAEDEVKSTYKLKLVHYLVILSDIIFITYYVTQISLYSSRSWLNKTWFQVYLIEQMLNLLVVSLVMLIASQHWIHMWQNKEVENRNHNNKKMVKVIFYLLGTVYILANLIGIILVASYKFKGEESLKTQVSHMRAFYLTEIIVATALLTFAVLLLYNDAELLHESDQNSINRTRAGVMMTTLALIFRIVIFIIVMSSHASARYDNTSKKVAWSFMLFMLGLFGYLIPNQFFISTFGKS